MSHNSHRGDPYEPAGVRTWAVAGFAAGFMLLLAAAVGGLYAIYASWVPPRYVPQYRLLPKPRFEANPARELHVLLSRQKHELNRYRWADKDHTLVAIPIERAMQIVAGRGKDAFAPIAGNGQPATQSNAPRKKAAP